MSTIRKLLIAFLMLLVTGCTSSPEESHPSPATASPDPLSTPPPLIVTNGTLTLTITSPADNAVVSQPQVEILGTVSIDAVLTLAGERHILPPGPFALAITLEEGENLIVVNASSLLGNEVEMTFTITYQP